MIRTALIVGLLIAQSSPQPLAQEPGPVTLTLRLAGDRREFRPGETIGIELVFESRVLKRFAVDGGTYDRSGRLTIDEFRLSPIALVTDPMLDYFASIGFGLMGGGLRGIGTLGEKPYTVTLELNDWFRFDTPGTFALSIRTNRVTDEVNRKPGSQPTVPVESNAVTFEILPRDAGWERAELERARQMLSGPQRRTACRILRFLGTNAAVDEMVHRYDDSECQFEMMAGLFGAPDRTHVVRQLESGLLAPDQPVTRSYLTTLSVLSVYLRQPELRPAQTAEVKGRLKTGGDVTRRPELVLNESERYLKVLEAALPAKVGSARAVSIAEHADIVRSRATPPASAAGAETARQQLVAAFAELPASRQETLLRFQFRTVADPALVPALRRLASGGTSQLADLALRRLYQLAPDEGRARILETIQRPHLGSTLQTLGALPDATLPELDDALVRNVLASITSIDANLNAGLKVELLHRYGSAAVSARMLAQLVPALGQFFACRPQAAALAYFLRVRPADGADLLDRALAARGKTSCYQRVLLDTAQLRMTPELEKRAVAALDDEHPRVIESAINTLGRFGSPASRPVLREHFQRWHRVWRDRADALQYRSTMSGIDNPGVVNAMIETSYLRALGAARGWVTSAVDVADLRESCVTDNCRRQADSLLSDSRNAAITVFRFAGPDEMSGRVAQYDVDSLAALGTKLAQYPKGTVFPIRVQGDLESARSTTAEIMAWAARQGLGLRPE